MALASRNPGVQTQGRGTSQLAFWFSIPQRFLYRERKMRKGGEMGLGVREL